MCLFLALFLLIPSYGLACEHGHGELSTQQKKELRLSWGFDPDQRRQRLAVLANQQAPKPSSAQQLLFQQNLAVWLAFGTFKDKKLFLEGSVCDYAETSRRHSSQSLWSQQRHRNYGIFVPWRHSSHRVRPFKCSQMLEERLFSEVSWRLLKEQRLDVSGKCRALRTNGQTIPSSIFWILLLMIERRIQSLLLWNTSKPEPVFDS